MNIKYVIPSNKRISKKKSSIAVRDEYSIPVIWKIPTYTKNINVNVNVKNVMRIKTTKLITIVLSFRLRLENLSSSLTTSTPFSGKSSSLYHEMHIKKLRIMGK